MRAARQGSMPLVATNPNDRGSTLFVHGPATSRTAAPDSSSDETVAPFVGGPQNCASGAGLLRFVLPMSGADCTTSTGGGRLAYGSPDPGGGGAGLFIAGCCMLCGWGSRTPRTGQKALRPPAECGA